MLFNSAVFGLFIAVLIPLYMLIRTSRWRKVLLLVASYVFYAHWDYRYVSLLALSTVVDYAAGSRLSAAPGRRSRLFWLLASLVTNLGILAVFKYGNFLVASFEPLWSAARITPPHFPDNIPVGISFYTFQTMSYTIDIYRGRTKHCGSVLDFALYVSFFAQLVAGPIVRSTDFLPQVKTMPSLRADNIASGVQLFLLGLFKKVVIADNVGLYVSNIFSSPQEYGAVTLWCGAYGFALQIFCDFSGYSDMAIGIGRAFGITIPANFNAPYLARSITEFWRRWHMSLSSWLRDYLYIPLGGNRSGRMKTYRNLMLTMLLGGLWHGASWTFVAWGGFHGALLSLERFFKKATGVEAQKGFHPGGIIRAVITFHLVCISWVMFRVDGFDQLYLYLKRMFFAWTWDGRGELRGLAWALVLLLLVLGQHAIRGEGRGASMWDRLSAPAQGFALAVLVLLVSLFHVSEVAFIYFQF